MKSTLLHNLLWIDELHKSDFWLRIQTSNRFRFH